MHKIDADLPTHQGVLEFKNGKAMVISRDKLASHAKGLREAAKLISTSTDRGKMVQTWLNEMADKFGAMEEGTNLEDSKELQVLTPEGERP